MSEEPLDVITGLVYPPEDAIAQADVMQQLESMPEAQHAAMGWLGFGQFLLFTSAPHPVNVMLNYTRN